MRWITAEQKSRLEVLWARVPELSSGHDDAAQELARFLWALPGGAVASYAVRLGAWDLAEDHARALTREGPPPPAA